MPSYWIGQREGEDEGERTIRIVRRAVDDDVEGHPRLRFLKEQDDDTEDQGAWRQLEPEGDDTIGHPFQVDPIDEEQGLYLIEVDSDEDVTGQILERGPSPEDDTEGQVRKP